MTTKIYSRLDPTKLLHMIVRDVPEGRTNLCPDDQFLQCAVLKLPKDTTFKAHRHIRKKAKYIMPEESWYVVKGRAFIQMYDTDGAYLSGGVLWPGHISFTFNGAGHNYIIEVDDTVILEYKVGPYLGVEQDKVFI